MKSFKEFSKEQTTTASGASSAEDLTKKIASAYHGKSNADMLRSILAEAERSKRAGTLSNDEIEKFYHSFSPMLDSSQRKKLRVVVDKLKDI